MQRSPQLDSKKLMALANRLVGRIDERFGASEKGLLEHAREAVLLTGRAPGVRSQMRRVSALFSVLTFVVVALIVVAAIYLGRGVRVSLELQTLTSEGVQALDAIRNLAVFGVVGLWFLFRVPKMVCRRLVIHRLDEIVAVVSVVRLALQTKDPERLFLKSSHQTTLSFGLGGTTTPFLMGRYLDYASELAELLEILAMYIVAGNSDDAVLEKSHGLSGAVRTVIQSADTKRASLATLETRIAEINQRASCPDNDEIEERGEGGSTAHGEEASGQPTLRV